MAVTYTISQLAAEFDVTTRTIRFYEDQGLISPSREGSNRVFSSRDRVRLKLALRGKRLGFSLAEIRELFERTTFRATSASSSSNSWLSWTGAALTWSSSARTSR